MLVGVSKERGSMRRLGCISYLSLLVALLFLILPRLALNYLRPGRATLLPRWLRWTNHKRHKCPYPGKTASQLSGTSTAWEGPHQAGRASERIMLMATLPLVFLPLMSWQKREQPIILHPYLFALFPSLSLVSDNAELLSINNSVLAIATTTLITTSRCFRLLTFVVKDRQKAGLLVSLGLLLFFSYGYVYDFVSVSLNRRDVRHRHMLLAWSVLAMAAIRFSLKEQRNLPAYTYFLNIVSGCLVALSFMQIAYQKLAARDKWQPGHKFGSQPIGAKGALNLPDIYYIILDAHASASTLSEIYKYDIGAFIQRLKDRGFFIADKSRSNYAMTMLSLASSLNMNYDLNAFSKRMGLAEKDLVLPRQMVENSVAMRFLMSKGYRTIYVGSGFGITQGNRYADVQIDCGYVDETIGRLIQSTLMRAAADRTKLIANDKRNRVRCMFAQLGTVHKLEGPKFILAHIPCPQWPFLFDAEGNPTNGKKVDSEREKEAYLNQLIFIDKKVEALIDEILAGSKVAPIIVLQSDHGPNFAFPGRYNLQKPPEEILREKMRIFSAFYLPGGESDFLYNSISPVNTFRLIFNHYFGSNFPPLDDRSYFSTLEFPYQLIDVTDLIE